ncbi:DUF262 domain-containing protein [Cypionkella sp. TWP1-2-1b2]|uniref:DUF262 domain-containing protein n=1 Tax=Cypionkella sp. TWP1-2-1b2 TaxID=2804675 RepID=UPI003CFBB62A
MDVHKSSVLAVFDAKQRLEVPLFQRQYVWNEEQQWLPLWEDIQRKFVESLEGRKDAPNHFLGALVLDQKQTPTGHVVVRQVIDGQQRLTTLQIFLAAYRDFCSIQACSDLAAECEKFLYNTGMMTDSNVDRFKVWPTQLDRSQFTDVISSGSRKTLLDRHPLQRKPYARHPEPRPRMVEAYLFFSDQLESFFLGVNGEPPLCAEFEIHARLDECFQTLRNSLMVVVIDLQKDDDPQVIFETLNARGEPLLPADLLKNYIFFRASRAGLNSEELYEKYWSRFDDHFWRQEVKQGRLVRPRSDLYMQHFLASRQGQDIPIKHLYVEYRHWLEREKPFSDVTAELSTLARQGDHFRRIIEPARGDFIFGVCSFLDAFDIRTAYPLLLTLLEANLGHDEWKEISGVLESYLLRRAVCNLGTQNYNRIFLSLTRAVRTEGFSAETLRRALMAQKGDSGLWPNDAVFREAWIHKPLYGPLNNPKLVYLFGRLNQSYMSSKSEALSFDKKPSVEHIMPQQWEKNWPLHGDVLGMDFMQLYTAAETDPRAVGSRARNIAKDTLGNLTILTTELNSSQSNLAWNTKKPEMMKHSLLPINLSLFEKETWNEQQIAERGEQLFIRAQNLWPR